MSVRLSRKISWASTWACGQRYTIVEHSNPVKFELSLYIKQFEQPDIHISPLWTNSIFESNCKQWEKAGLATVLSSRVEFSAEIDSASRSSVKIARKLSAPIVVRGRSPDITNMRQGGPRQLPDFRYCNSLFQPVESEVIAQRPKLQQEARYETGSYRKEDTNQLVPARRWWLRHKRDFSSVKRGRQFWSMLYIICSDVSSLRTMSTNTTFSAPSESMRVIW